MASTKAPVGQRRNFEWRGHLAAGNILVGNQGSLTMLNQSTPLKRCCSSRLNRRLLDVEIDLSISCVDYLSHCSPKSLQATADGAERFLRGTLTARCVLYTDRTVESSTQKLFFNLCRAAFFDLTGNVV